jgi:hypothetical protein
MNTKSNQQPVYNGPVIAATLAPLLAFVTLMVSHHISRLSPALDRAVHAYGYWIPGAVGSGPDGSIGSYSGKETMAVVVWVISWLIFHYLWRQQDFSLRRWSQFYVISLLIITLGFFHPVIDPLVLLISSTLGLP